MSKDSIPTRVITQTPSQKIESILSAMLSEVPLEHGGHTYRLFKPNEEIPMFGEIGLSDNYFLGVRSSMTSSLASKDAPPTIGYLGADLTLTDFLDMIVTVSADDSFMMSASKVLREVNHKERKLSK